MVTKVRTMRENKVYAETVFMPHDYITMGNKLIQSLPLIDTSLYKLSGSNWWLFVTTRWVPSYGFTKLRYRFSSPKNSESNRYLIFSFWLEGKLPAMTDDYEKKLISLIHTQDFQPNFNKPATFQINPVEKDRKSVDRVVFEDELSFLTRINEERAKLLPKKKVLEATPPPALDNVVDISQLIQQVKQRAETETGLRRKVHSS